MTTIENKLEEMLFSCGLFEDQATAVVEMVKADEFNEEMSERWQDDVEDYPR